MVTDRDIISAILAREGGFVDHPQDRGAATNWGITLATLSKWRKTMVTPDDVKKMSRAEAEAIYEDLYLKPFKAITPGELRAFLVDSAVNHGITGAIKLLQRAVRVDVDGYLGAKTMEAIAKRPWRMVLADAVAERVKYYGKIVRNDPSQVVFLEGWLARMEPFIQGLA